MNKHDNNIDIEVDKDLLNKTSKETILKVDVDDYIKGPDKFPLQEGRFGFLPFIIQNFIGTNNKKCQVSVTNKNLKKKHPCFLRKGPENSKNKSFLGCIIDIYYNNTITIDTFINDKLIPIVTPDIFVSSSKWFISG